MSFSAFEHQLIDHMKAEGKSAYTVACSGGLDSVVLLCALKNIQPVLKSQIKVLHIHHGSSGLKEKIEQSNYRDEALKFVEDLAAKNGLDFVFSKSNFFLETEEACRDYRQSVFKDFENVLTAHHKDDFSETLLMRMIRGSGPQGLKNPFNEKSLKPFLELFNKAQIRGYSESKNLDFVHDPSNSSSDPLRNWLRNSWLKDLDDKIGREGFEKSLLLISEALVKTEGLDFGGLIQFESEISGFFTSSVWLDQSKFQKQSMIAHILLKIRKKGYTHGQIEEVVKQLDQIKKSATFRSGKMMWQKSESKVSFRLDL